MVEPISAGVCKDYKVSGYRIRGRGNKKRMKELSELANARKEAKSGSGSRTDCR